MRKQKLAKTQTNLAKIETVRATDATFEAMESREKLRKQTEEFQSKAEKFKQQQEKLKQEIKKYEGQIKTFEKQKNDKLAEIANLQKKANDAQNKARNAQSDADLAIKNARADADSAIKNAQADANREIQNINNKLIELENRRQELLIQIAAAESKIESLETQNKNLETENKNIESQVTNLINPGILIQNGQLQNIPGAWKPSLEKHAKQIEKTAASVGKIVFPGAYATGFIVGKNIVLTADFVIDQTNSSRQPSYIDFRENAEDKTSARFAIRRVLYLDKKLGFALLEVEAVNKDGKPLPPALEITEKIDFLAKTEVYLSGYPQSYPRISVSPSLLTAAFPGQLGVKRIQPGILLSDINSETTIITHNSSTSGGSSGSPLIDLNTGKVIGVHVSSRPATPNQTDFIVKEAKPITSALIRQILQGK